MPDSKGFGSKKSLRDPGTIPAWSVMALAMTCLVVWATRFPFPVPRFMVPERTVVVDDGDIGLPLAAAARGGFATVRIKLPSRPTLSDLAAARTHYAETGMPVSFTASPVPGRRGVAALATELDPLSGDSRLTLLLAPDCDYPLRLLIDGQEEPALERPPPDRRVTINLGPGLHDIGLSGYDDSLKVHIQPPGQPRVLLFGDTPGRTVVEAMVPVHRAPMSAITGVNVYDYETVVLDGPSLPDLGEHARSLLSGYVRSGAGSLVLYVDGPGFGVPGDAPEMESILPVDLSPPVLERLPDVSLVVALDVSGSMLGDRLALAKAAGLELAANLKPDDELGILVFSDEASWLYHPGPASELDAPQAIAPLKAGGGTRLLPALEMALGALSASTRPERRLVIVSDGIAKPESYDEFLDMALRAGVSITALAIGGSDGTGTDTREPDADRTDLETAMGLLARLSATTGGQLYPVGSYDSIPSLIMQSRTTLSRTVFEVERTGITDLAGRPAGFVDAMARFGLRDDAIAWFSSEWGDPLLATHKVGQRTVAVFASDAHGRYDGDFLARPDSTAVLGALLSSLVEPDRATATLTETAEGATLSLRAGWLAAPELLVSDEHGSIIDERSFTCIAPGYFGVSLPVRLRGRHTVLVRDRGMTVSRWQVWLNGGLTGRTPESVDAEAAWRTPFWAMYPGREPWLVVFMALSMLLTVIRRRYRPGNGRKDGRKDALTDTRTVKRGTTLLALILFLAADPASLSAGPADRLTVTVAAAGLYTFGTVQVRNLAGLSSMPVITGKDTGGDTYELLRGGMDGITGAKEMNLPFYVWPQLAEITVSVVDASGRPVSAVVPMRSLNARTPVTAREELQALEALVFPVRDVRTGRPPDSVKEMELTSLSGTPAESAAQVALSRLFLPVRKPVVLLMLAAWTLVAMLTTALPSRAPEGNPDRRPVTALLPLVAGSILVTGVVIVVTLSQPQAELYDLRVPALPSSSWPGTREGPADAAPNRLELPSGVPIDRLCRLYSRSVVEHAGWNAVRWAVPGAGEDGLHYIALRSPRISVLPLSALDGFGLLRFRRPPTLVYAAEPGTDARTLVYAATPETSATAGSTATAGPTATDRLYGGAEAYVFETGTLLDAWGTHR